MKRVTGIGGIFFKSPDPERLKAWYQEHLGIEAGKDGASFYWRDADSPERRGQTVWSVFPTTTRYLDPSPASFMINYRVENLDALLAQLRQEGVAVDDRLEEEYGRFAWVMDPDGNRIELWEPPETE